MVKIFAPIKGRIFQYIESQKLNKEKFFEKVGISISNFKGKSAQSEIGGEYIAKILTECTDINPIWLILGKGEMQVDEHSSLTFVSERPSQYDINKDDLIFFQREKIKELERELESQKSGNRKSAS